MGHVLHFSSKEETPSEEGRDSEEERDKFSREEEADRYAPVAGATLFKDHDRYEVKYYSELFIEYSTCVKRRHLVENVLCQFIIFY